MIQRIQSLYLLLAAACGTATWFFNLWKADFLKAGVTQTVAVTAQSNFLSFVLYMLIVTLAVVCIFLYKNRKLQFRLTVLNVLLAVCAIFLQYFIVQGKIGDEQQAGAVMQTSTFLPAAFLPIVILILLFLAAKGIYKDEKLIKSLDRLR
ncbi:uncharacterized protein DUF4293 [Chitinophaga skermanii]|uniref:Uncharacterized protein DUF4293 n=1 Tax=Chitinophaga skermanii TaxID=331697 RepID=A0A327R9P1_9BACT|nr:DUF4293 domain-containing protein [Chitinophaga skermanii]RAJ10637.1 uncharacterized protein DUF4293 [Chitinophaga skermanii]